jgi:hypothetical protein
MDFDSQNGTFATFLTDLWPVARKDPYKRILRRFF